jgi:hypothetical protein
VLAIGEYSTPLKQSVGTNDHVLFICSVSNRACADRNGRIALADFEAARIREWTLLRADNLIPGRAFCTSGMSEQLKYTIRSGHAASALGREKLYSK